ncbi:MAG: hypothetical protein BWZ10_00994 [candidate division BRC1 bacterium ADurb.BinA364]|nr:MAG: hypothetical protein BWZ10_00994 [candidate division BRC1 bacterium ADurb.BinA364]
MAQWRLGQNRLPAARRDDRGRIGQAARATQRPLRLRRRPPRAMERRARRLGSRVLDVRLGRRLPENRRDRSRKPLDRHRAAGAQVRLQSRPALPLHQYPRGAGSARRILCRSRIGHAVSLAAFASRNGLCHGLGDVRASDFPRKRLRHSVHRAGAGMRPRQRHGDARRRARARRRLRRSQFRQQRNLDLRRR